MLPGRQTPAMVFMEPAADAKKAMMLVSDDVKSVFGDSPCVFGAETCQLLALEPGVPETFVYGGSERTYRIKLLKVNFEETEQADQGAASKKPHARLADARGFPRSAQPRYRSISWSPASRPTIPPSARNGPNGIAILRAFAAVAGEQRQADHAAGQQSDEDRRCDGATEEQAHRRRQLDVAEAHARRDRRGRRRTAARRRPRRRSRARPARRGRSESRSPGRSRRRRGGSCWG